jgi:hypothetical protein
MRCIFYVSSSPEHPRVPSDSRSRRIRISAPFRSPTCVVEITWPVHSIPTYGSSREQT